jgi:SNF2 family DNA or RNA helicase
VLDVLSHQADLEEAPQPPYIISTLHKHQRQALTFMLGREKGWNFDSNTSDIWESFESTQGQWFINKISDTNQLEAPPPFSGGIVADPMGLGKTLTMIALAATDLNNVGPTAHGYEELNECKPAVQTTLIVVPQPCMSSTALSKAYYLPNVDPLLMQRQYLIHGKSN